VTDTTRKLATIVALDVAGYSARTEADEARTTAEVAALRKVIEGIAAHHGGRVFNTAGDGFMLEFGSSLAAVEAAFALAETCEPKVRVGVHLGDVVVQPNGDLLGHGVNVAARLMAQSLPGAALISAPVRGSIRGPIVERLQSRGHLKLDKMAETIEAFGLGEGGIATGKPEASPKIAVCVLPFANMSGESEQEYFADGISEDIITDLSQVSALSVISRNSAFMYKGKHIDLPKVARELKVSHVLEGSVRKSGQRVRITAQLINGATNEHVWAERFDRDLNDIFAVQDEISEAIVKALKVRLLPEEKKAIERRGTENVEAWSLVAEARQYLLSGRTSERYFRAVIRFCERALALDPNFAEAWATIAQARNRLSFDCGFADEDGFDAANRALELDDKLSLAHAALAMVYSRRNQAAEAEASIAKALELEPDRHEIVKGLAAIYFRQRKFREAMAAYERAALLNPTDASAAGMMNTCAGALGDRAALERSAHMIMACVEPLLAREPDNTDAMGWLVPALATLSQTERVHYWINRALMFDPGNFTASYNFACALIRLGAFDEAIDLLRKTVSIFTRNSFDWMKADPDLNPVRGHPRYIAFVAELEAKLKNEAG